MRFTKVMIIVLAIALIPQVAMAGKGDKTFRFGLRSVNPTGDYSETVSTATLLQALNYVIEADSAIGPAVGFEYMFNDKVGFDVNLGMYNHDVEASFAGLSATIGEVDMMPLMFGANFHLTPEKNFDFYLGPTLGYVMFSDLEISGGGGDVAMSDDFGFGANFGIDVPFNDNWAFSAGLQYFVVGAETDEPGTSNITVDIDPWVIGVGLAYKF